MLSTNRQKNHLILVCIVFILSACVYAPLGNLWLKQTIFLHFYARGKHNTFSCIVIPIYTMVYEKIDAFIATSLCAKSGSHLSDIAT